MTEWVPACSRLGFRNPKKLGFVCLTMLRSELGNCEATSVFSVIENIYLSAESGVGAGFCILRYVFDRLAGTQITK